VPAGGGAPDCGWGMRTCRGRDEGGVVLVGEDQAAGAREARAVRQNLGVLVCKSVGWGVGTLRFFILFPGLPKLGDDEFGKINNSTIN